MKQLFSSNNLGPEEGFKRYLEVSKREFYDGELVVNGADAFDIQLDKVLMSPVAINHVRSCARMSYLRQYKHIRGNRAGFKMISIVKSGSVHISRSNFNSEVRAGHASIVDIDCPFKATHAPGETEPYEAFQIVVPPDLFFRHLSEADLFSEPFDLNGPHGHIVRSLLQIFVDHAQSITPAMAEHLTHSLLEGLGAHLGAGDFNLPKRRTITEQRWSDVKGYIMLHLTDPDLSYDRVAASCGISTRYLSYLLKANETSFSQLVWSHRISKAREWLLSQSGQHISIDRISQISGFKNPSHFSRKFKEEFGCAPNDFRRKYLAELQRSKG